MITLLTSEKNLLSCAKRLTDRERDVLCTNLEHVIALLDEKPQTLLANRLKYGVLLPQEGMFENNLTRDELIKLPYKQILLEQPFLIQAVNSLGLTEATLVQFNFIVCLDKLNGQYDDVENTSVGIGTQAIAELTRDKELALNVKAKVSASPVEKAEVIPASPISNSAELMDKPEGIVQTEKPAFTTQKNNVAPIRLNAIKQRLADAVKTQQIKQDEIKNRLNNLVTQSSKSVEVTGIKQA